MLTTPDKPSLLYLWENHTLYLGPLVEPVSLRQGAAMLMVSLDLPVSVTLQPDAPKLHCRSLLTPADAKYSAQMGDAVMAVCYLDPMGYDYAVLKSMMNSKHKDIYYDLTQESIFIDRFSELYHAQYSSAEAYSKLINLIHPDSVTARIQHKLDPRIVKVVDLIKQTIRDNVSIDWLAQQVHLSPPRLMQLFKQQTGLSIRRYRLWNRLYVTATHLAKGLSITEAAIEAGFSDSSHFSHVFRSVLGMKPSLILGQFNQTRIITETQSL